MMRLAEQPLDVLLAPLATRVRLRWLAFCLWRGALGGLILATALVLLGRQLSLPNWPVGALALFGVALTVALVVAAWRMPGTATVARAADDLGLAERVSTSLYTTRIQHPLAPLLDAEARRALAALDPAAYSLTVDFRYWQAGLVGVVALSLALLLPPLPLGDAGQRAADAQAVSRARQSVQEIRAAAQPTAQPAAIARASDAQLRELDAQLARAQTAAEAAQLLESAQEQVATLPSADDYTARRTVDNLAATWAGQPGLDAVARALADHDPAATRQALAALAKQAQTMSPSDQQRLQLALQSGANAARDLPNLASSLRQAASAAGTGANGSSSAGASSDALARAMDGVASSLGTATEQAAGVQAAEGVASALGQARADLGGGASAAGGSAAASGAASGANGVAGNGTAASVAGAGASSSGNRASGQGSTGTGAGGSGSQSSATGAGGSGIQSGGTGASGSGAGAGAGAGGTAQSGQPRSTNAGATLGGGTQPAGNPRPQTYDPIYTPSLLGGSGGSAVQATGSASGANGQTVATDRSPLTGGAVRPYDQVYGQYAADARQSLSRQPLPPALQGLVQRYFSAIAPQR